MGARRWIALCVLALVGASVPSADAQAPVPSRKKPVLVEGKAIKRGMLRDWQRAFAFTLSDGTSWRAKRHRITATAYLIEQRWVAGEARGLGIAVSGEEVMAAFERLRARFESRAAYARYLKRTRLDVEDVLASVHSELLSQRITALLTQGSADVHEAQRRILEYRAARKAKWQPRTICAPSWKLPEWCA